MSVKISILGIPQTMAFLKLKAKNIDKQITDSMKKIGRHMQNEVKSSISGHEAEHVSVDTGHLMRNVFFDSNGKEVIIYTNVPYANYVENSTRIKGGPRRHFQNSFNRNKQRVINILKGEINI